jgi:hypothetical protein
MKDLPLRADWNIYTDGVLDGASKWKEGQYSDLHLNLEFHSKLVKVVICNSITTFCKTYSLDNINVNEHQIKEQ